MRRKIIERVLHSGSSAGLRWFALPLLTGAFGLADASCAGGDSSAEDEAVSEAVQPLVATVAGKSATCPSNYPILDGSVCRAQSVCASYSKTDGTLPTGNGLGFDCNSGANPPCSNPWPLGGSGTMTFGAFDDLPTPNDMHVCSCTIDAGINYCTYLVGAAPCGADPYNAANVAGAWSGTWLGMPKTEANASNGWICSAYNGGGSSLAGCQNYTVGGAYWCGAVSPNPPSSLPSSGPEPPPPDCTANPTHPACAPASARPDGSSPGGPGNPDPNCDNCGNIKNGDPGGQPMFMGIDPVNLTSRVLSEVHSCLKLPEGRGAHIGVSVSYDSGLWELGRGDASVSRGFTVGNSSYITSIPATGAITRYLKLNAEGPEDFTFDASAATGPYYSVGKTAATAATWIVEEKTGTTVTGYQVVTRRGEKLHYTAAGQLDGRQDETGNHVTITWEGGGNLKRITNDATGQSVELAYGVPAGLAQTKLLEIRDAAANRPAGSSEPLRKVTLVYDTNGRLAQLKEDFGQGQVAHRSFAYDAVGRPANMYDANNAPGTPGAKYTLTEFEGTTGRVISQTAPNGVFSQINKVTGQAWNIEVVLANNTSDYQRQRFTLDANGRVTRRYDNTNSSNYTAYEYNASGQVSKVTDPEGRTVETLYDAASGQPTQIKLAGGTADQAITSMTYDAAGRPTQITDPMGRVTEMVYCASVTSVCGVVGALRSISKKGLNGAATPIVTLFETNQYNQVTAVVQPDGTRNTVTYDSLGLPASATVAAGTLDLTATTTYDWRGYLRQSMDPRGILTQYEVNGRGWVTAMIEDATAGGKAVRSELTYDNAGNVIRLKEDAGSGRLNGTTEMDYFPVGPEAAYKVIEQREAVGTSLQRKTTFSFTPAGEPYFTDQPRVGATRHLIYAQRPEFISSGVNRRVGDGFQGQANGLTVTSSFDRAGQLTAVVDERGSKRTMTYNARGDLSQVKRGTQAVGANPAVNATTNFTYFADGKPSMATNPTTGYQTAYTYDTYGRLDTTTESGPDTSSRWSQTVYDTMDRVTSQRRGTGAVTLEREDSTYDAAGRPLTQIKDPLGLNAVTTYSYTDTLDPNDKVHLRKVTDPTGSVTRYRYDTLGKLVETIDPASTSFTFTYDNLGHMLSQSGAGRTQSWTVDILGRTTEHTSALGTERWAYNPDDTKAFYCPVSGQASACDTNNAEAWKYSYNTGSGARNLMSIDYPERAGVASADASYTYATGVYPAEGYSSYPETALDAMGKTEYTYDALNRLVTKKRTPKDANGNLLAAQAKTLTYGYKAADTALASIQYWDRGTVNYTTNAFGQVTKLTDWASQETNYTYSATGQVLTAAANLGAAYTASYTYDTARRLSRVQHTSGASNLLDMNYAPSGLSGRDAKGNVKSIRETWLAEGSLDTVYSYDALDRLVLAQYPELSSGVWGAGAAGVQYNYTQDAAGNVTTINGVATFTYDTADRITSAGFTHDANGNMTASGAATLASNPQPVTAPGLNWHAEGSPNEAAGLANLTWTGTATYASSPTGVGQAFALDGTRYLSAPSTPAMMPQTELTVGATIRIDSDMSGSPSWPEAVGLDSWTIGQSSFAIGVRPVSRKAYCDIYLASTTSNQPSSRLWTGPLVVGETYRLETTYNPTTGEHKCILNGATVRRIVVTTPEPIRVVTGPLRIGRDRGGANFVGLIDEVRIVGANLPAAPFGPRLYDGAFSMATFDSAWSLHDGWGTRTAPAATYVTLVDHDGTPPNGIAGKFARITWPSADGSTGNGPGISQQLLGDFVVQQQYRLTFWARSADGGSLWASIKQEALAGYPNIWTTVIPLTNQWTKYEYTVSTSDPSYATQSPTLRLVSNAFGMSVDVDGISWEPMP